MFRHRSQPFPRVAALATALVTRGALVVTQALSGNCPPPRYLANAPSVHVEDKTAIAANGHRAFGVQFEIDALHVESRSGPPVDGFLIVLRTGESPVDASGTPSTCAVGMRNAPYWVHIRGNTNIGSFMVDSVLACVRDAPGCNAAGRLTRLERNRHRIVSRSTTRRGHLRAQWWGVDCSAAAASEADC